MFWDRNISPQQNDFEDFIDNFTPKDDIPKLMGLSISKLDELCHKWYNCKFADAYDTLMQRALYYDRKAFNNLAKSGNSTAISVVAKYFMKLDEDDKNKELRIVIDGNIPLAPKKEDE